MMMRKTTLVALVLPLLGFVMLFRSFQVLDGKSAATSTTTTTAAISAADANAKHTASSGQPTTPRRRRKISLVVRMRGEMANLVSHLVFAKGIQLWVEDNYGSSLTLELIGERQSGSKWRGAVQDLQTCFPNLRQIFFQGGRWDDDFKIRREQQREWVGEEHHRDKLMIDRGDSDCGTHELFCLHDQLAFLQGLLLQQEKGDDKLLAGNNFTRIQEQNRYSLPFLVTNRLASFDVLVDQYFDQIKEWLSFDYGACCSSAQPPSPDEVVLHLRNFRAEMRERNYLERGYEELSPNQVAHDLLGHLPAGSKVAIASRGEAYVDLHVNALKERGLQVRTTPSNHSGVQDFCFLLQTQRELVGTMRSTYTRWAALLGEAQLVRLYSIDSPSTRKTYESDNIHYQWKRPELKGRISYRVFASNETLW